MTASTKRNIKSWLPFTSFLPVFYLIFYIGQFTANAESRMFESSTQKEQVISHTKSKSVHMPLIEKEEHFVTRREYESAIIYIKEALQEIKNEKK